MKLNVEPGDTEVLVNNLIKEYSLSKTKQRTSTELEHYKGLVRELEKENRSLKKENKELSKQKHIFIDKTDDNDIDHSNEDTYIELKPKKRCSSCGKGFLEEFEIMNKIFATCNICGERNKIK